MSISQAYKDLLPPEAASDLKIRFQEFYAALAERAEPMLRGPERSSWKQILDMEHDNLIAALELAVEEGNGQTALRLAASLWPYWDIRANWQEGLRLLEEALSTAQDKDSALSARATLGKGVLMQNDVSGSGIAFLKQAHELADLAGDLRTAADALSLFAVKAAYAEEGLVAAARWADKAIQIAKESEDEQVLAAALHRRADLFWGQGDYDKARAFTAEALEIRRKTGDLDGQRESLTSLAWMHDYLSQTREARRYMEEGIEVARAIGDELRLASILQEAGWIIDVDPGEEMGLFEEALSITRRLGNPTQIGDSLMYVGWRAYFVGDYNRARQCFEEAVELYRGKDPARYGNAQSSVGWVDFAEGRAEEGLQRSRDAIAICRTSSNRALLAWQLSYHGELSTACGDPAEGLAHLREAMRLNEELQNEASAPMLRLAIAWALSEVGDPDGALKEFETATGSPITAFPALLGIARIQGEMGNLEEASSKIKEAYELGIKSPIPYTSIAAHSLEEMALIKVTEGNAELAARILGTAAEIRHRTRKPINPVRRGHHYRTLVQKVRDALGPESFEREFVEGQALTEQEAIESCWGIVTNGPSDKP